MLCKIKFHHFQTNPFDKSKNTDTYSKLPKIVYFSWGIASPSTRINGPVILMALGANADEVHFRIKWCKPAALFSLVSASPLMKPRYHELRLIIRYRQKNRQIDSNETRDITDIQEKLTRKEDLQQGTFGGVKQLHTCSCLRSSDSSE